MRILFISSSLEPGKDGVGDYTRSLAEECVRQGQHAALLALHDRHLTKSLTAQDSIHSRHVKTLRCAAARPWPERIAMAAAFCAEFQPDCISLQFVPYGFHDKGFAWKVANYLRPIVAHRQVHVMFHELWLGGYRGARIKERLSGTLQRACILRVLRNIRPNAISTSNAAYVRMLKDCGHFAAILPMFGSIPFAKDAKIDWLYSEIRKSGVSFNHRDELWLFCMFGSLHPIWPPEPLFQYLHAAAESNLRKVVVISIGKLGSGDRLWAKLCSQYTDSFHFVKFGQRRTEEVSAVIQSSNFGLATSPWELIGKSSSTASMLEHGLPVIVNRDEIHFRGVLAGELKDPLLIKLDTNLPRRMSEIQKRAPHSVLPDVTQEFLSLLKTSSRRKR